MLRNRAITQTGMTDETDTVFDDLFRVFEQDIIRCRLSKHLPHRYVARMSAFDVDLLVSLQNLAQRNAGTRTRPAAHVCSRLCSFICDASQNSDIYLCSTTGNMHRCSSQRCALQLTTKEFRICRRTLRQFPLEFQSGRSRFFRGDTQGDDGGGGDEAQLDDDTANLIIAARMESEMVEGGIATGTNGLQLYKRKQPPAIQLPPRTKRMRFALFPNAADAQLEVFSPTQREAQTGIPQRLPKACHTVSSNTLVSKQRAVNLDADARAVITRALVAGMRLWANAVANPNASSTTSTANNGNKTQHIKPPEVVVTKIITQCTFWWHRIIQCKSFLDNAFSYKFPTHCLVMLYMMVDGFRVNNCVIVDPVDYVRVALPGGNALKRNLHIKPGLLTNSEKFFRRCIAEWLEKDKAKVEYTIATNRRLRGHDNEMLRVLPPTATLLLLQSPVSPANNDVQMLD